jgi:hypothetical protein
MCVNQRLVYLQRMLGLRHGEAAFGRFAGAVTDKVMERMGVHLPQGRREFRDRNAALCSLPAHLLSGMLYLCRDNIQTRAAGKGGNRTGAMEGGEVTRHDHTARQTQHPHKAKRTCRPRPCADTRWAMCQWPAYGRTPSTATRTSRPTHDPRL